MLRKAEPQAASIFFALGDQTRLGVLAKLSKNALSATSLSDGASMTRQAVVKHLQVLEGAGLVTHQKHGREVLYALERQRLDEAREFLEMISAGWGRAIGRLRAIVEEKPGAAAPRKRKRRHR